MGQCDVDEVRVYRDMKYRNYKTITDGACLKANADQKLSMVYADMSGGLICKRP